MVGEVAERPLAFASLGQTVSVSNMRIKKQDVVHHLENLGFIEGSKLRVVADQQGNIIVEVKGSRVAINRATASKIMVV